MKSGFHGWSHTRTSYIETDDTTNLCYMVRSIVIYLPFMIFMRVAAIWAILEAAALYPMSKVGWRWWIVPGWIVGTIVVLVIFVVGCILLYEFLDEYFKKRFKERSAKPPSDWTKVVGEFIVARHNDICPEIVIDPTKKER